MDLVRPKNAFFIFSVFLFFGLRLSRTQPNGNSFPETTELLERDLLVRNM